VQQANSRKPRRPCSAPASVLLALYPEYVPCHFSPLDCGEDTIVMRLCSLEHAPSATMGGETELPLRPGRPTQDRWKT
jgi:hypothetical protein